MVSPQMSNNWYSNFSRFGRGFLSESQKMLGALVDISWPMLRYR